MRLADGCRFFRRETYGPGEEPFPNRLELRAVRELVERGGEPGVRNEVVPRSNPSVFWRKEHFGAVVFRVTDNVIFSVDDMGVEILSLVDEKRTLGEIIDEVASKTRSDKKLVTAYVAELSKRGALTGHLNKG